MGLTVHEVLWPQQVNPISQNLNTDRKEGRFNQSNLSQSSRWFDFTWCSFWPVDFRSIIRTNSPVTEKIPDLKFPSCIFSCEFFSTLFFLFLQQVHGYGATGLFVSFIITAQVSIFWKASCLRISLTESV